MSNKIFLSLLLGVCFLIGCGKEDVVHYGVDAKGPSYENLEQLEEDSGIIVHAVREKNETPIIQMVDDRMVGAYTFSYVTIKEVFKDSTGELEEGDCIRILENEVYNEDDNTVYHIAGYNMMKVGKEYILFLTKEVYYDKKPYYVASGASYGTVSMEDDGRTCVYVNRNGNPVNDFAEMKPIWDEALKKYGNIVK